MKKSLCFKIIVLFAALFCIALFIIVFMFSDEKMALASRSLSEKNELVRFELDETLAYILKADRISFRCTDDFSDCRRLRKSVFFNALILQILSEIGEKSFQSIIQNGIQELLEDQSEYFFWNFSGGPSTSVHFFPDLDTSSLSAYFLDAQGADFHLQEIKESILGTQFENGAFLTYLRGFQPPLSNSMNIDPVVNANVLVILEKEIPSVCTFINDNFDKSIYYQDDAAMFYMLAKAYSRGCGCIKPSVDRLYEKLKKSNVYSSKMHLSMFVIGCFLSKNTEKQIIEKAIEFLLENEEKPPFKESFFSYENTDGYISFYNPTFSAAVYAEALTNIKSYLSKSDN